MTNQPTVHDRYGITILPPFMRLAVPKKVYTVAETKSPHPRYYIIEDPAAGIFTSIAKIDHYIHQNLGGSVLYDQNLIPHAGQPDHPLQFSGHLVENAALSNPAATGSGVYFFSSDDLATQVEMWTAKYLNFLDIAERWLLLPDEFILAYRFVKQHPAFYHRHNETSDNWEQEEGLVGIWQDVWAGEQPHTATFSIEHGPYDDEMKTRSSHDHYLDAYGKSYEAVMIDFAKNVHNYYTLLGTDRDKPLMAR